MRKTWGKKGTALLCALALTATTVPVGGTQEKIEGKTGALQSSSGAAIMDGTVTSAAVTTDAGAGEDLSLSFTQKQMPYVHVASGGVMIQNAGYHNYCGYVKRWSQVVESYLFKDGKDYVSVQALKDKVYIQTYDSDFVLKDTKIIDYELEKFGGFYCGEDKFFLVFGADNKEESDEQEVMRVVAYDKKWNCVGSGSVYGANTYQQFDAGSLRMTEAEGFLYVYTCHEMYQSSDGYHHQANQTFVFDEGTMKVTQQYYGVMNLTWGYVSHSFNQFILADEGILYRLDHGDAHARAVSITRADCKKITSCKYQLVFQIQGNSGNNWTGVTVGGFQKAGEQLLVAGTSNNQNSLEEWKNSKMQNIFVLSTSSELEKEGEEKRWLTKYNEEPCGEPEKHWLTDYSEEQYGEITVSTPHLVRASDHLLYVMWEETDKNGYTLVKIAPVDENGIPLHETYTLYGRLSDCEPIYTENQELEWYAVDKNNVLQFYKVDTQKLDSYPKAESITVEDCQVTCEYDSVAYQKGIAFTPKITGTYGDEMLTEGEDYTLTYYNNDRPGTATVAIEGKGVIAGETKLQFAITPMDLSNAEIVLEADSYEYDGMLKKPSVEVYLDGELLVAGTDYYVQYQNNQRPGTATVTVTGKGVCQGSCEVSFTILPKPTIAPTPTPTRNAENTQQGTDGTNGTGSTQSGNSNSSSENGTGSSQTGTTIAPGTSGGNRPIVTNAPGNGLMPTNTPGTTGSNVNATLKPGIPNATSKPGTTGSNANATLKPGIPNATSKPGTTGSNVKPTSKPTVGTGTQTEENADTSSSSKKAIKVSITKITAGKKALFVKWKKVSVDGYQIQFSRKANFTKAKIVTVKKAKTTNVKIGKLAGKKKYYVRIRSYVSENGEKSYSAWSNKKSAKTK